MKIEDTRVELSCAVVTPLLDYVSDGYGLDVRRRVLERAGLDEEYVLSRSNWISYAAYNRLLEAIIGTTGNPRAAFEASQIGAKGKATGALQVVGLHLLSVANIYRLLVSSCPCYSKVGEWRIIHLKREHATFELRLKPGYRQTRNNCEAVRGFLSAMPQWLNQPPAEVKHELCMVDGADCCVYEITWTEPRHYPARIAVYGAILVPCLLLAFYDMRLDALGVLKMLMAAWAILATGLWWECRQESVAVSIQNTAKTNEISAALQELSVLNQELQCKVEQRTIELSKTLDELKTSQEKEVAAARQAAIGVLAAGMAHELNNPMNAITLSLQGIKEDVPADGETRELVKLAELAARRCRRIVTELLAYSCDANCKLADLADIVSAAVIAFRAEQPGTLSVSLDMASTLVHVSVDRGQFQQVMMNLLNNAAEVMGGTGMITVRVRPDGGHVVISVRDTGPGMSEETRKHVFDPFFTTKPQGKGLGLGLAITWQLVQRNGGTIDVRSREGEGAEFVIRLPLSAEAKEKKGE